MNPVLYRHAVISPCEGYRYTLSRGWNLHRPWLAVVAMNPSKADAVVPDPTLRKVVGFATRWEYGGVVILNVFARRSTNPDALMGDPDPVGPDNDAWLDAVLASSWDVWAAWGSHRAIMATPRAGVLFDRLRDRAFCIGFTQLGQPKHPLMPSYREERVCLSDGRPWAFQ